MRTEARALLDNLDQLEKPLLVRKLRRSGPVEEAAGGPVDLPAVGEGGGELCRQCLHCRGARRKRVEEVMDRNVLLTTWARLNCVDEFDGGSPVEAPELFTAGKSACRITGLVAEMSGGKQRVRRLAGGGGQGQGGLAVGQGGKVQMEMEVDWR